MAKGKRNIGAVLASSIRPLLRRQYLLILDTILLGVVGALSAQLFSWMLRLAQSFFLSRLAGYKPPGLPNEGGSLQVILGPHGLWLIPLATTLGGLITGLLVYGLAPEAEGHGTDTAVKAYHFSRGFIRARIPFLKMVASAITIGSGGAAGREGPTALISAGIGSIYASLTRRSEADRRLLVLIGMASGLSAIFRSPIGTAIFAVEVLYGGMEFEAGALIYTMLGSIIAYVVNGLFVGYQPLFQVPTTQPPSPDGYLWYVLLGVAAGLIATLLPMLFYTIRDFFGAIHIPPHVKPAIGGLAVGLLALFLPQVLSGGYGYIQLAIQGGLPAGLMLALVFGEILALSLTISSGGSGGVFAPSLFVGAMLGGFLAKVLHQPTAALTVVGMMAVFGGAARVPIATLIMVTEMTGDYTLLAPAALAVMLSFLIQNALSANFKYKSLYEAQVPLRSHSPAHYLEQLEAILRLLSEQHFLVPSTVSHLDLRLLLASGIPVDLPGNKQLMIGVLRRDSPFVDQPVQVFFDQTHREEVDLVTLFRDGKTLLPDRDLILKKGDRLLVVASASGRGGLASHLTPLDKSQVIFSQDISKPSEK